MRKKSDNLDGMTIFLMVFTAAAFDIVNGLANAIPIAGQIISVCISIFSTGTFWLWFTIKGHSFSKDPKRALTFFGINAVEFIPILNVLPATTAGVIVNISMIKLSQVTKKLGVKKDEEQPTEESGKEEAPEESTTS